MPMGKKKQESLFTGLWHIVSMSGWDEDYFSEEVQAFIEFEANGTGHFQFGYVQGGTGRFTAPISRRLKANISAVRPDSCQSPGG
jgi:hypothetical protein